MNEWISTTEALPKPGEDVLIAYMNEYRKTIDISVSHLWLDSMVYHPKDGTNGGNWAWDRERMYEWSMPGGTTSKKPTEVLFWMKIPDIPHGTINNEPLGWTDWIVKQGGWIDPNLKPPKDEEDVLIKTKTGKITIAMYESGNIHQEDSSWGWNDIEDWADYDDEKDDYIIPEGWYEHTKFNADEQYNNLVDEEVIGWRPLEVEDGVEN